MESGGILVEAAECDPWRCLDVRRKTARRTDRGRRGAVAIGLSGSGRSLAAVVRARSGSPVPGGGGPYRRIEPKRFYLEMRKELNSAPICLNAAIRSAPLLGVKAISALEAQLRSSVRVTLSSMPKATV